MRGRMVLFGVPLVAVMVAFSTGATAQQMQQDRQGATAVRKDTVRSSSEKRGAAAEKARINRRNMKQQREATATQGRSSSDIALTKRVREEIQKDKELSAELHNVEIISNNGVVTLKGQVPTLEEKGNFQNVATNVAGQGKVKNELKVRATQGR